MFARPKMSHNLAAVAVAIVTALEARCLWSLAAVNETHAWQEIRY